MDQATAALLISAATGAFGGGTVVLGIPAFQAELARRVQERAAKQRTDKELKKEHEELSELLRLYLLPKHPNRETLPRVPLVPALHDPWGPENRVFSGSGNKVAAAYAAAFSGPGSSHIVRDVDVETDDAPVLIASHLVSAPAAQYFGNPKSQRPVHKVSYTDGHGGFKARLRWAIYTPDESRKITKLDPYQKGPDAAPTIEPRLESIHHIADWADQRLKQPTFVRQGKDHLQRDDYLLISVLPRDSRCDRRVVSLAGLYKPGTLAAAKLLDDLSSGPTREILKSIDERVRGAEYYQALIHLEVDHRRSELTPVKIRLVDAEPIDVKSFSKKSHIRHDGDNPA
jgi:hypothetical protein